MLPVSSQTPQWRQFTNFLGGRNFFYGNWNFFCDVLPKAPYRRPMFIVHVLKCTKAWYACTYIGHWINETNKQNFEDSWRGGVGGGGVATSPSPLPIGATETPTWNKAFILEHAFHRYPKMWRYGMKLIQTFCFSVKFISASLFEISGNSNLSVLKRIWLNA